MFIVTADAYHVMTTESNTMNQFNINNTICKNQHSTTYIAENIIDLNTGDIK